MCWLRYARLRFPNLTVGRGLNSLGPSPFLYSSLSASIRIGEGCTLVNHTRFNTIGVQKPCSLAAHGSGLLLIGDRVGLSGVSICSYDRVEIQDDVLIGANTFIFDTDFHSLAFGQRMEEIATGNFERVGTKPVMIKNGAFVGANCIIGKGVTIGTQSIIAAGSVVTHDVPDGEIWGGNPARLLRSVEPRLL